MKTMQGPFSAEELERLAAAQRRLGDALERAARAIAAGYKAAAQQREARLRAIAAAVQGTARG